MLSVIIITKNEENNIKRCLESIKGLADEIVIVDSYSEDKTTLICSKYTNNIYLNDFLFDGARQRNYALSKTTGEWVLALDADERVSNQLRKLIPILIKTKIYKGYLIPRRNYINKNTWLRYGLFFPDYQLRLFRKEGVKFVHPLHTYPNLNEKFVKKIKQYLIHNDSRSKYDSFLSLKKLFRKDHNHIFIQAKELLESKQSLLLYLFKNHYFAVKYFIDGYLLGKGFLDGWKGFRAAIIFSLIPIIVIYYAIFQKLNITKKILK